MKFHKCGKRDAAKVLDDLFASLKRGMKIKKSYDDSLSKKLPSFTADEALAMYTSAKLTKKRYKIICMCAVSKGLKY